VNRRPILADTQPPLAAKLEWLRRVECYPEPTQLVEALETHFAWVFFTDRHAYKLKKPVRLDGSDFRTLAFRAFNCREELRLNRRLAPDVYLDVVPLARDDDGSMRISGCGETVEWLVRMRRLDAARMLDTRLASGNLEPGELRPALAVLSAFYATQSPIRMTASGYRRRLEAQVERNRDALLEPALGIDPGVVRDLTSHQLGFLATNHELVADRSERRIVEAHGDLRPEHIFLGATPAIIDCLEFDRDLRSLDPVEELAYLGLECTRAGAAWVRTLALERYAETTRDRPAHALVDFYASHRAATRAKIVAWHQHDPEYRHRSRWSEIATEYLQAGQAALDDATGSECRGRVVRGS
jgi:uncharacterized protein